MASALCISRHFLKAGQDPVNPQNNLEYCSEYPNPMSMKCVLFENRRVEIHKSKIPSANKFSF